MAHPRPAHPVTTTAAALLCVAAASYANPALSDPVPDTRTLAAELLIAQGDLQRMGQADLPEPHRAGLVQRIEGALGILPWLLQSAGDTNGAATLSAWQGKLSTQSNTTALTRDFEALTTRYPLDLTGLDAPLTAASVREARAIHEEYCAGCHDDMGTGDPDVPLPARDLYLVGREESPELSLARLINGIKGDETILFVNPMTDAQVGALWKLYQTR